MRILAFVNQKGGTAKTTSCLNVGAALSLCGLKCLLVDMDPQGNLSQSAGYINLGKEDVTTYEVLKGAAINKAIRTKGTKGGHTYDVLPADVRLSAAEVELVNERRRNYILKEALTSIKTKYDFILIDCPPSLNIFSLMALTAATEVIIPVQAQFLPLQGVAMVRDTISIVRQRFNPGLQIGGVLLTFFDERRNLDHDVLEALNASFKGKVFNVKISQNTKLAEAPCQGKDVFEYSGNSRGAYQYKRLAAEIIGHESTEEEAE